MHNKRDVCLVPQFPGGRQDITWLPEIRLQPKQLKNKCLEGNLFFNLSHHQFEDTIAFFMLKLKNVLSEDETDDEEGDRLISSSSSHSFHRHSFHRHPFRDHIPSSLMSSLQVQEIEGRPVRVSSCNSLVFLLSSDSSPLLLKTTEKKEPAETDKTVHFLFVHHKVFLWVSVTNIFMSHPSLRLIPKWITRKKWRMNQVSWPIVIPEWNCKKQSVSSVTSSSSLLYHYSHGICSSLVTICEGSSHWMGSHCQQPSPCPSHY